MMMATYILLIEVKSFLENLPPLEYFDNNESATPSNTPSAKKAAGFSLKTVDFSKFLENINDDKNDFDNFVSNDFRQTRNLNFCENTYVGTGRYDLGCSINTPKV